MLESALPGYELPFAQLREDEDLPVEPMAPMPGLEYPALDAEAVASSASAAQERRTELQADAASGVPLPPVEYPQPEPELPLPPAGAPAMALVEDSTSPAAVLRPSARKPPRSAIPESFKTISSATITASNEAQIKVPMLVLCGEWLKAVGFPIGSSAVLTTDKRGEIALNRLGLGLPRRLYIRATPR